MVVPNGTLLTFDVVGIKENTAERVTMTNAASSEANEALIQSLLTGKREGDPSAAIDRAHKARIAKATGLPPDPTVVMAKRAAPRPRPKTTPRKR